MSYDDRIRKSEWCVRDVPLSLCQRLVAEHHYARGGSNTGVYTHGLFRVDDDFTCYGIAWWLPPTRPAAESTFPENWKGVLALSRLAILPGVPKNAASFLLARSRRMIDRSTWPCLVTYADEWRGHTGHIYTADNWTYVGKTKPSEVFVRDGVMVSRKAGPKTRTRAEMAAIGAEFIGAFPKHKFIHVVRRPSRVPHAKRPPAQADIFAGLF